MGQLWRLFVDGKESTTIMKGREGKIREEEEEENEEKEEEEEE